MTTIVRDDTGAGADRVPTSAASSYPRLAEVLATQLSSLTDDPAAAAEAAGAAWGRHLVARPTQSPRLEPREVLHKVLELLTRFGFSPDQADGDRVLVRHCPFGEVSHHQQEVVCSIHLGIMRGALEELGGDVELRDLLPFVEPDLCVAHLRVPATRPVMTTSGAPLDV